MSNHDIHTGERAELCCSWSGTDFDLCSNLSNPVIRLQSEINMKAGDKWKRRKERYFVFNVCILRELWVKLTFLNSINLLEKYLEHSTGMVSSVITTPRAALMKSSSECGTFSLCQWSYTVTLFPCTRAPCAERKVHRMNVPAKISA